MPTKQFVWDGGGLVASGSEKAMAKIADALASGDEFKGHDLTLRFIRHDKALTGKAWDTVSFETVRAAKTHAHEVITGALGLEPTADLEEVLAAIVALKKRK